MGIKDGLSKLFERKADTEEDYLDLDLDIEEYEAELKKDDKVKMYVKTAELTGLYDVPELKKEIYAGNMLILDISLAKRD